MKKSNKKVTEIHLQLIYKVSTSEQHKFLISEMSIDFLKQLIPYEQNMSRDPTVIYSVKKAFKTVQKQIQQNPPKYRSENGTIQLLSIHFPICHFSYLKVTKNLLLQVITVFHVQITCSITVIC